MCHVQERPVPVSVFHSVGLILSLVLLGLSEDAPWAQTHLWPCS